LDCIDSSMEETNPQFFTMGVISGGAACFWLGFTGYWTYTYFQAQQQHRQVHGWPFYLSALLYLVASVAYFTAYSLYACKVLSDEAVLAFHISYVLYMPLAYLLGMSCCLGFGTLYTQSTVSRALALATVWTVVTVACVLMTIDSSISKLVAEVVFLLALAVQVLVSLHTLRLFGRIHHVLAYKGHTAFAITLLHSRTRFLSISMLFGLLFALHAVLVSLYEVNNLVEQMAYMCLWAGFVGTAAAVNSWVLLRLRPSDFLWDVEVMAEVYANLTEENTVDSGEV